MSTREERAAALGLLHSCDQCIDEPEARAEIEEQERVARGLPTLHRAPDPPIDDAADAAEADRIAEEAIARQCMDCGGENGTHFPTCAPSLMYDCDGCGTPTPRDELHHYEGPLTEGWFCDPCTTGPA